MSYFQATQGKSWYVISNSLIPCCPTHQKMPSCPGANGHSHSMLKLITNVDHWFLHTQNHFSKQKERTSTEIYF